METKDFVLGFAAGKAQGGGGDEPTGTIQITSNGNHNVKRYATAAVNVPNSYAASDEGKVVSNGELVTQTARESQITQNGTYDTTLNDEVTVNVSGGGTINLYLGSDAEYYMDEADAVICTLSYRTYKKYNNDPAFVAYFSSGAYTGPVLVSETIDGAKYYYDEDSVSPNGTAFVWIDGKTYYISSPYNFITGNLQATNGFAKKLDGIYQTVEEAAKKLIILYYAVQITDGGLHAVPDGYNGFGPVNAIPLLQEKTVTSNGMVLPDSGYYGLSKVVVNTSGGSTTETASVFRWLFSGTATTCWGIMKKLTGNVIGQNGDNADANIPLVGDLMTVTLHGNSQSVEVLATSAIRLKVYRTGRTLGPATMTEHTMAANDQQSFTQDNVYGGIYFEAEAV